MMGKIFFVSSFVILFYHLLFTLKRYTTEVLTVNKLNQKIKHCTLLVFAASNGTHFL